MSASRFATAAVSVALLTACSLNVDNPVPADSQLRIINVANVPIDVKVDGSTVLTDVVPTSVAAVVMVAGAHQVELDATGGSATVSATVSTVSNGLVTTYVYSPNTSSLSFAALDTATAVAGDRSKLRVSNFSQATGIQVWRTQPDVATPTLIQTPFPYLTTSPFIESTTFGLWEVFVTRTSDGTKIASTGQIALSAGQRATVLLMDSASTVVFRVLPE